MGMPASQTVRHATALRRRDRAKQTLALVEIRHKKVSAELEMARTALLLEEQRVANSAPPKPAAAPRPYVPPPEPLPVRTAAERQAETMELLRERWAQQDAECAAALAAQQSTLAAEAQTCSEKATTPSSIEDSNEDAATPPESGAMAAYDRAREMDYGTDDDEFMTRDNAGTALKTEEAIVEEAVRRNGRLRDAGLTTVEWFARVADDDLVYLDLRSK